MEDFHKMTSCHVCKQRESKISLLSKFGVCNYCFDSILKIEKVLEEVGDITEEDTIIERLNLSSCDHKKKSFKKHNHDLDMNKIAVSDFEIVSSEPLYVLEETMDRLIKKHSSFSDLRKIKRTFESGGYFF